jgi:23S rRNA (pseudouridine1915-N3)-methyltransferase
MIVTLAAIGRLKPQEPEQALTADWIARADALARPAGLRGARLLEVDPRLPKPDPLREAQALLAAIDPGAIVVVFDERGEEPGSRGFSRRLATFRDQGARDLALLIGGPDGHGEAVKAAAQWSLAFGPWTWPHKLARAMAAEQIYRACAILAGTPYHRD